MMKTIEMEISAMSHFGVQQNLIVPNVSNMMWLVSFEADLLILNKNNYAHSLEIKVSKSDLKNDLKKNHIKRLNTIVGSQGKTALEYYYGRLKHFSYFVPDFLEEEALKQIPEFSGLYIGVKYPNSYRPDKIHVKKIRSPKKLFGYKWSMEEKYQIARLGSLRILGLKKKINKPLV